MEEEPFNPDYMQVDRILDEAVTKDEVSGEEVTHYLVKWASLPYEDSTWELSSDVLQARIDFFHKIGELRPDEVRVVRFGDYYSSAVCNLFVSDSSIGTLWLKLF